MNEITPWRKTVKLPCFLNMRIPFSFPSLLLFSALVLILLFGSHCGENETSSFKGWAEGDNDVGDNLESNSVSKELQVLHVEGPLNLAIRFIPGSQLSLTLFFNKVVEVKGTPRIEIELRNMSKKVYAEYRSGGGSSRLIFAYDWVFGDFGYADYKNEIDFNGGSILPQAEDSKGDSSSELKILELPKIDLSKFRLWPCEGGEYVLVPRDSQLGFQAFCVASAEMRNSGGSPSTYPRSDLPWVDISRDEAISKCRSLGPGYDLMSLAQWNTLVHHIENDKANWPSLTIGSPGGIPLGHSDGEPDRPLPTTGAFEPCYETGQTCEGWNWHSQRRILRFGIYSAWDLAGNVGEWLKDDEGGKAVMVGDHWRRSKPKGIYSKHTGLPTDQGYYAIGFRCIYVPQ